MMTATTKTAWSALMPLAQFLLLLGRKNGRNLLLRILKQRLKPCFLLFGAERRVVSYRSHLIPRMQARN